MIKESEYEAQCTIFEWAKLHEKKYPCLRFMFATLNGIRLPIGLAKKAKRQGNKSGPSDIILPYDNGKYNGLFLELKVGKNKASDNQKRFLEFVNENGYLGMVVWGSDNAIKAIEEYVS